MTYSKPEVRLLGSALVAVQRQTRLNKVGSFTDSHELFLETGIPTSQESTASAYEADE